MTEQAVRMAIHRGQLDPDDLNSVVAFKAARNAVLSEAKKARMEASASPRGTVLSENRLNALYDLVGSEPPLDVVSVVERLSEDVLFVHSIESLFKDGDVEENQFAEALQREILSLYENQLDEDHLKHLWGAIRKAAHRVHKALKKTMGGSFYTYTGAQQKKPLALSGPQQMHIKAAATRAKVHQGILRQQQKRAG